MDSTSKKFAWTLIALSIIMAIMMVANGQQVPGLVTIATLTAFFTGIGVLLPIHIR